jgi:SpoVK/Ycf46/Vps4 family AAA+-type ATPase
MTRLAIGWLVLIIGGILAVLLSVLFAPWHREGPAAAVAGGLSFVTLICYGVITAHYCGIRRHVFKHLGGRDTVPRWQVVTHVIPTTERVNVQLALDHLRGAGPRALPVFGIAIDVILDVVAYVRNNPFPQPLQWESFPRSLKETMNCATNALYLLRHQGVPFCAFVRPRTERSRKQMELQVLAVGREDAKRALAAILETAQENNIYKGSILSLRTPEDPHEEYSIRFHDLAPVQRDSIVLPQEVMAVVERNVLGLLAHADILRRAGRSTRHGVLLYGPPGTGKTLVTRYLACACPRYTVILLTGRELKLLRPSCQLARLLAPSMVVLEDVDLVASDRRHNRHNTILHELMDEMDGLGSKTDCIFLLTTNRPELLESALAARPGRVDQAIYFPLPDRTCRRRLFTLFGKGLDLVDVDLEPLLERTEGASPAFLQEMFRKAALLAAERGEQSDPLRVTSADFDKALREIIEFGGALTRNLLGFQPGAAAQGLNRSRHA